MISHITLTTSDLKKSELLYDGLFSLFGAKKTKQLNRTYWESSKSSTAFILQQLQSKLTSTNSNKATITLAAKTEQEVSLIYNVAMRLGATCAGKPSQRGGGMNCAYVLDTDANKIAIIYIN